MITPQNIRQAKRALGTQLAALRKAAGLRQEDLAKAMFVSRSSIANTEIGHQVSAKDFWEKCDRFLYADGNLVRAYEQVRNMEAQHRRNHQPGSTALGSVVQALPATTQDPDDDVRRRDFLPLAAAAAVLPRLTELGSALLGEPETPASALLPPPGLLLQQTNLAKILYQACDYERLLAHLPPLLADVKAALQEAGGEHLTKTYAVGAAAYHVVASLLLKIGDHPLALLAAERSTRHAQASSNPVTIAASARIMAHALASSGHIDHAVTLAQRAAQHLESDHGLTSPDAASVYGALVLRTAIAAARTDDRNTASILLDEGERAAARLGHEGNHYWTGFGPSNVLLHRVNAALTLGDAGTAINLARKVNLDDVQLTERKVSLYVDVAQAYAQWGRRPQALAALRAAYSLAPQEVRTRPTVRRIVGELVVLSTGSERSDAVQFATTARLSL